MLWSRIVFLLVAVLSSTAFADTVFVEAESFVPSSAGWVVANGPESRQASGTATLHGADGPGDATASQTVTLKEAGHYRIWVRFRVHPTYRGPFTLTLLSQDHKPATPSWATHEGGPPNRTTVWYAKPEMWRAQAELAREIGPSEDLLLPAMPPPAEVAILYSSASDAWTIKGNLAYGFDRMHTWLALAHAQVPSDIVHESGSCRELWTS